MSDRPPGSIADCGPAEATASAADFTDNSTGTEELLATFDGRLTAAERRMERILAQLGVDLPVADLPDPSNLVAAVDKLLKLQAKQATAIDEIKSRLLDLDRRVTRLDGREEIVVAEAKAAAGAAAAQVTMLAVADMARRIGGLEAQTTARLRPV